MAADEPEHRRRRSVAADGLGVGTITNAAGTTIAYAACGDTNLDGFVDVSDIAAMMSYVDAPGTGFHWSQGDFNYDGRVDELDLADFLGAGLFDLGWHLSAAAAEEVGLLEIVG